jgi:uncharacterized repeat protein (TIGR04042 family)
MPEVRFDIRWPDGHIEQCYSPSTVIRDHLAMQTAYPLGEFLERSRTALSLANDRVRAKFGVGCAQAIHQIASIERTAATFAGTPDAVVIVETIKT